IELLLVFERLAVWMMWAGFVLVVAMLCAVVAGRVAYAWHEERRHRFERHYGPLAARALEGDAAAQHAIVTCPPRDHLAMAMLLITPLIDDRDPRRVAVTRAMVRKMTRGRLGERLLRSRWWWRRALADMQDPAAVPALVTRLHDASLQRGRRAAALAAFGPRCEPLVLELARDN